MSSALIIFLIALGSFFADSLHPQPAESASLRLTKSSRQDPPRFYR
jgi:hypothetical protein